MQKTYKVAREIRDYVNNHNLYSNHFQNLSDQWNILCVAMDTLEDTCLALQNFEKLGVGNCDGERYLRLYGFLQAIFLQQDAIGELYRIFTKNTLKVIKVASKLESMIFQGP